MRTEKYLENIVNKNVSEQIKILMRTKATSEILSKSMTSAIGKQIGKSLATEQIKQIGKSMIPEQVKLLWKSRKPETIKNIAELSRIKYTNYSELLSLKSATEIKGSVNILEKSNRLEKTTNTINETIKSPFNYAENSVNLIKESNVSVIESLFKCQYYDISNLHNKNIIPCKTTLTKYSNEYQSLKKNNNMSSHKSDTRHQGKTLEIHYYLSYNKIKDVLKIFKNWDPNETDEKFKKKYPKIRLIVILGIRFFISPEMMKSIVYKFILKLIDIIKRYFTI